MLMWWGILFTIGLVSFADTLAGSEDLFRKVVTASFLLASLGLLIRITRKIQAGEKEVLAERVFELEQKLEQLKRRHTKGPVSQNDLNDHRTPAETSTS